MGGQGSEGVPGTASRFFRVTQVPSPLKVQSTDGVVEAQTGLQEAYVMKNTCRGKAPLNTEAVSRLGQARSAP